MRNLYIHCYAIINKRELVSTFLWEYTASSYLSLGVDFRKNQFLKILQNLIVQIKYFMNKWSNILKYFWLDVNASAINDFEGKSFSQIYSESKLGANDNEEKQRFERQ